MREPIELAMKTEARSPIDLAGDIHHRLTKIIHGDEPLVDEPEHQVGIAAPADGVSVSILLSAIEQPLLPEVFGNGHGNLVDVLTRERSVPFGVDTELVNRRDDGEIVLL